MPVLGQIKLELKKRKAVDTSGTLYLRVSIGGPKPYERLSTGYVVNVADWDDDNGRLRDNTPNAKSINEDINRQKNGLEEDIRTLKRTGKAITNAAIVALFPNKSRANVLDYFAKYMAYLKEPRKNGKGKFSDNYIKKMQSEYNKLDEYTNGQLTFDQVDKQWMQDFEIHFGKTLDPYTSLPTTISKVMGLLRKAEDDGLFSFKQIKGYVAPSYRNPERPYLTLEQTEAILKLLVNGELDSDLALKSTAAYFLVECYCGIRFSDWHKLKVERLIKYDAVRVRAKKNHEPVYFRIDNSPRLNQVIGIITRDELKPPSVEQLANRYLKDIAPLAGIGQVVLSTHVGRHTAATLFLETGYSLETVAEILGISLRTVAIYAKMTRRKINKEYDLLGGL